MNAGNLIRTLTAPVINFLYPPVCFICNALLENPDDKICPACWSRFHTIEPTHRIWNEIGGKFWEFGVITAFTSQYLFEKEGPLQETIHLLKYRGVKTLGTRLGRDVGARIKAHPALAEADFLVPIPLHPVKQRERGYNQAEYVCKGISEVTGIPVRSDLVRRCAYTETQTRLDLQARRANVAGAFEVIRSTAGEIHDKAFILVDDVITTGSTMNECAALLRLHGAAAIYGASAALAQ